MPRRRRPSELPGPSTRAGALARGVSDWRLRHPDVVRLSRDTYLPRGDDADLRSRLPAVLLTAPAGAVVSHHTAAAMWRVEIPLAAASSVAHLTVPPRSKARNRADRHLHRTPLSPEDVERRWGMPVTSPARTWRDLAAELAPAALLAVTDQLLDVLCRPAELEEALRRRPTGHGAARARRVLAVADPRVDSPMESGTRWLLHEAGLPRPTLQYRLRRPACRGPRRACEAWGAGGSFRATCTGSATSSSTTCGGRTGWSWRAGSCCASPPPTSWVGRTRW
ncbi:hypothetical protein GCU49_01780 [Modestobacter roseus]|nr:hypothetical protein [Modestobacter roseus]